MTQAQIIDGKAFAANLRKHMAVETAKIKEKNGVTPGLAVVLVGEDPASKVYVKNKNKSAVEVGFNSFEHKLSEDTSEEVLLALVEQLNNDDTVNGILVQLPLPKHINETLVLEAISPAKDVDGFHPYNVGKFITMGQGIVPCTPYGCIMMLRDFIGDMSGKKAIVIGRSNIVGKPMAQLLLNENCTVTMAHSRTKDLAAECKQADIVVAAVGRPEMVRGDWIKKGATIIDVGMNRVDKAPEEITEAKPAKTKLVGDVNFKECVEVAGAITPVPGGVGPMTIAVLLRSALVGCCEQNQLDIPEGL
ncbi:MAG: bifunctional methylenetetrahydrofolate dehydrogenase/methenyltetrahydrofolate cyclohydrolase FolD [Alphaproteobacteria bacterium]|nr:bifunctional methylenetetrahydrofolate dehydrogenase/methenyltetrahydrofolate cyclohydrolase FolD [Alphaproteobacteria bacterium]